MPFRRSDAGQKHNKPEEDLQRKCVAWLKEKDYFYEIGSTGHFYGPSGYAMANRIKSLGAVNGVSDLQILEPNPDTGRCLFVELKIGTNVASDDQKKWLARARARGHTTAVLYSFDTFVRTVTEHLTPKAGAAAAAPIVLEE